MTIFRKAIMSDADEVNAAAAGDEVAVVDPEMLEDDEIGNFLGVKVK